MTAASATDVPASNPTPAPETTMLVDSAAADTAFKNLEPAFMFKSYLFPTSRGNFVPTPVTVAVLPAFPIQASQLVNFCLLQFEPWLNGHYSLELS
ncbi:hypothetical protein D3C72_2100260 [compost metagenome]